VGYQTPVFIQPFPWHHHITITYNRSTSTLADSNPNLNLNPNLNPNPNLNHYPNINPNLNPKPVVTIIFDGKLWSCKQAYGYASLEWMPIWEYPKIGPWFEKMTSVDADLRSGRRLETGRRSESIIFTATVYCLLVQTIMKREFKQLWSSIPPISTKRTITSHGHPKKI
jgi:hypothetical protein